LDPRVETYAAEAIEASLVGVLEEAERIEEAKRRLRAELTLERGHRGNTGGRAGGRSEGSSRAEAESEDGGAHFTLLVSDD
jgi:hypothetical protein